MRAPFFVPANPHTCTPDTPTRPRPSPVQACPLLYLPLHCSFAASPSQPQPFPPHCATLSFTSFFHSGRTNTTVRQRNDDGTDPPTPPSLTSSRLSIKPPYSATLPYPPANRLDLLLHLFSHRTVRAVLVSTLSTHSTTLSQFQPLNCILRTSFHMGQADGRKTLILEYSADTRARAHSRRKESRHSPGTNLPRHLLQPACPVNPAGRLA